MSAAARDSTFFEALGRDYLIDLSFVPLASRELWAKYGTPAGWIAKRLCIEHPDEMRKLRQKLEATPQAPKPPTGPSFSELSERLSRLEGENRGTPAEQRGLSAEQQRDLNEMFGIGDDKLGSTYDARTGIQTFGVVR